MLLNVEEQVHKDVSTLTEWCRNYYEDNVIKTLEKKVSSINLSPLTVARAAVEKALREDTNLIFYKVWNTEENGHITVLNMAMHELAALLVHDGFNILWDAPGDPNAGSDIVIELMHPLTDIDYINVETVDTYRAGFIDTWMQP